MLANPKVVVFTITTFYPRWYRGKLRSISHTDKVRGDLALKFIQKASSLGYQLVAVDGKSSRSFRKELNNFSSIKIVKRRGYKRSPAKRQAFKAASQLPDVKVIIATEPEKFSLIDSTPIIVQPILETKADIVIPEREELLFKQTYPDYMYESEVEGNILYNEQLKLYGLLPDNQALDMFFGPRAFANNPKVLSFFVKRYLSEIKSKEFSQEYFDPEEYSNTQYFSIITALKKGLRIKSVEIPFIYPKEQRMNEERGARELFLEKRQAQRLGILLGLMYLLNYLKK